MTDTHEITTGYWHWCNSCQSDSTCKLCDGCRRGENDEKPPSGWPGYSQRLKEFIKKVKPAADLAGVTTDQIVATYNQMKQVDQYFKIDDQKKEINAIFSALVERKNK